MEDNSKYIELALRLLLLMAEDSLAFNHEALSQVEEIAEDIQDC